MFSVLSLIDPTGIQMSSASCLTRAWVVRWVCNGDFAFIHQPSRWQCRIYLISHTRTSEAIRCIHLMLSTPRSFKFVSINWIPNKFWLPLIESRSKISCNHDSLFNAYTLWLALCGFARFSPGSFKNACSKLTGQSERKSSFKRCRMFPFISCFDRKQLSNKQGMQDDGWC